MDRPNVVLRALVLGVVLLLLPLGWIPTVAAQQTSPCCTEQHLHAGDAHGHGVCPQHQCCVGSADSPAPRPTGTPLVGIVTPAPRLTGASRALLATVTAPSTLPISRAHAAGLPLLC